MADRLGSTLFLAALAHGVVILGVTFTSLPLGQGDTVPSLNVTLVVDTGQVEPTPDDAEFLAQKNQAGHGALPEGERPTAAPDANQPRTQAGNPDASDLADGEPREAGTPVREIVTPGDSAREVAAEPKAVEQSAATPQQAAAMIAAVAPPTLAAEIDARAESPKAHDRELVASPSTRESVLAEYLDDWRRRVERIGTLNFPERFRGDGSARRPTLEVAIDKNGQLADIVVRRSSGDAELDQAALNILRMAAPFDPLPEAIRAKYDVLRFAYEWEFKGGASGDSAASLR
ncbi:MAG TPA: TonB family protein [Gammaproteobacteria bacterium]|nr:TonB family protein [Gammaproteobacteria bacterium]